MKGEIKNTSLREHVLEVAFYWHEQLMSIEHFSEGTVFIGPQVSHSLKLFDAAIGKGVSLAAINGSHVALQVPACMSLHVNNIAEVNRNRILNSGDVARLQLGGFTFILRMMKQADMPAAIPMRDDELDLFKIAAMILIMHVGWMIAINMTPKLEKNDDDLLNNPLLVKELVVKTEELRKKEEIALFAKKQDSGKHKGEEGKFGRKDKAQRDAMPSASGAPNVVPDKKERDRQLALTALKNLGLNEELASVSNKLGPGGLGKGANTALGGLRGTNTGDAGGSDGFGTRGSAKGGGGKAVGIGGLGTGVGKGFGGLDLDGSEKSRVRVIPGKIMYEGGLTQDEIQRVIKLFLKQIGYCYSKELQKNPELEGKLVASWVIGSDGRIQTSRMSENTMNNSIVEECVLRVISRMKFPEPRGGGVVSVTYPFVFSAAGA